MVHILKLPEWKPWPELAEMMKIAKKHKRLFLCAQKGLLLFPSELEEHWKNNLYRWNITAWVLVPWQESVDRFEDIIAGYEEQKKGFVEQVKKEFGSEAVPD